MDLREKASWIVSERLLIGLATVAVIASVLGGVISGWFTYEAVDRQIAADGRRDVIDRRAQAYADYLGTLRTQRERITELHFKSGGDVAGPDDPIEASILEGFESVEQSLIVLLVFGTGESTDVVNDAKAALDELHRAARDARDDYDERLAAFDRAVDALLRLAREEVLR